MLLAHGVGSRGDLPLPLYMFTWASAIALVVSFVALGVLWTRPRLASAGRGRVIGGLGADAPVTVAFTWIGRIAALVLFLTALAAGLFGVNDTDTNLLPVTFYVVVWVGVQLINGLVGDIWRPISPITTLAMGVTAITRRLGVTPTAAPAGLGHWPAAAGLFVFLFYELAHPSGAAPLTLGLMLATHTVVSLVLAARWGTEWIAEHEPFAALFAMLGFMAVLFRRGTDLVARPPMTGLATMPVLPGTLATLLVVLGGTSFDGFSESELGRDVFGRPTGWGGALELGIGLAVSIVVISALYGIGVWWTARVTSMSPSQAANHFTPSLVPIVFGYAIAHYAQLLVDETQTFVFLLSDPFGQGWNLFGGADGEVNLNLISVDLIAWVQVSAILFGHVGAVIVAHDKAVELFKPGESLRSQFAMLLVMVAYSTLGLWLLLNA
ncbi:MAG: hypothetical protein AAF467_11785 [Actinomycetota bacterium]